MEYDVFISYRRDKGTTRLARNLKLSLEKFGLQVFFDMEELTDGKFNEKIYQAIEASKNVIFLMTEGALDRCVNEGDWVRNELEHTVDCRVNLIPVTPTGTRIHFPEGLPEKLAPMRYKVDNLSDLPFAIKAVKTDTYGVTRYKYPRGTTPDPLDPPRGTQREYHLKTERGQMKVFVYIQGGKINCWHVEQ